jgi:hypothetical protein
VNIVVAAAVVAVEGDPDVLEESAILVLILGGMGSANGEKGAALVGAHIGKFGGLLLHGFGNGRRRVFAGTRGAEGALGIDAGYDEDDGSRSPCRPSCVAR